MFGSRSLIRRGNKDEAEKPFWISYADLMTSLMVLFLVTMSLALLAVTKDIDRVKEQEQGRKDAIDLCFREIERAAAQFPGIAVNRQRYTINFGKQAQFEFDKFTVGEETGLRLRAFTRELLKIARTPCGQDWLKRVVIEGYTDYQGDYLYNLKLSLDRSHMVLCALLTGANQADLNLNVDEQHEVQKWFFVGGYSSNSVKPTLEESRRIEFKLEFWDVNDDEERRDIPVPQPAAIGKCRLKSMS